jgi:hypothetical protein
MAVTGAGAEGCACCATQEMAADSKKTKAQEVRLSTDILSLLSSAGLGLPIRF